MYKALYDFPILVFKRIGADQGCHCNFIWPKPFWMEFCRVFVLDKDVFLCRNIRTCFMNFVLNELSLYSLFYKALVSF
jgi:hypothetical protein